MAPRDRANQPWQTAHKANTKKEKKKKKKKEKKKKQSIEFPLPQQGDHSARQDPLTQQ